MHQIGASCTMMYMICGFKYIYTPRKLPEGSIQVTYKCVFPKSGPTPIPNKQYNRGLTTNLGPKKFGVKKFHTKKWKT